MAEDKKDLFQGFDALSSMLYKDDGSDEPKAKVKVDDDDVDDDDDDDDDDDQPLSNSVVPLEAPVVDDPAVDETVVDEPVIDGDKDKL